MAEDPDEVAVCTECHTDVPLRTVIKSPFFHQGGDIPCKVCGGVVRIVRRVSRDQALAAMDERRGVYNKREEEE